MVAKFFFKIVIFLLLAGEMALADPLLLDYSYKENAAIKKALFYVEKEKFDLARSEIKKVGDPLLADLVFWMQYSKSYPENTYQAIADFVEKHPGWPENDRLKRQAEHSIPYHVEPFEIIQWFKDHDPVTARGKWLLANARLKKSLQKETVDTLIRQSWVEGEFTKSEEEDFLKQHQSRLREKDYFERIDRLLWEHKATAASRILKYVSKNHQKLFNARILLIRNRRGLNRAIRAVPESLQRDSGLLYERARWRQRRDKVDGVLEIVNRLKETYNHANQWWRVRHILARDLIKAKRYREAYQVAHHHGTTKGSVEYAQAEWLSGWIALRFLNQPRVAYEHFYHMYKHVSYPISQSRASYWAGRAAEANTNRKIAAGWYKLASQHPTTFYGQLALDKLNQDIVLSAEDSFPEPTRSEMMLYKKNGLLKAAHLLIKFDQKRLAKKFIKQAVENAKSPGELALISEFGLAVEYPQFSVIASKSAHQVHGVSLLKTNYPQPAYQLAKDTDKALAYSIIRQESLFNPEARSGANARGLMQLIPSTARRTSRQLGLRYNTAKLTKDPHYNTQLGSYYITQLVNKRDQSLVLAIASYNAGPGNVNKWIKTYGDPRTMKNIENIIDWVELIPFSETRNYVQRVLENKQVYSSLFYEQPVSLASDLIVKKNSLLAKQGK